MFTDGVKVFPTDFVRVLGMFQGAVNQAVDSESISEDYDFNMEELTNDAKVTFLAAKLSKLAGEKDFKMFLKEPPEEEMTEEEAMEEETVAPPTEEETDKLFMGRM
jgi:tRNA U38,U39,U40 pseudouridine synthase TruA